MTNQIAITMLKTLEQSLDDYCELNDEGKTAFSMAITALELFGNSEQLPSTQLQWIPVFERLPNNRSEVIVSVNDGGIYTTSDWYSDAFGFYAYGKDVVAWMPLPEPYKEEQHD